MREAQQMVADFHRKHGVPVESTPRTLTHDRIWLRERLHGEECKEVSDAMRFSGVRDCAKEIADMIYVLLGTACEMGIDVEAAFREVHRSNMTKSPGEKRGDGKVVKGADYVPVDPARLVAGFGDAGVT